MTAVSLSQRPAPGCRTYSAKARRSLLLLPIRRQVRPTIQTLRRNRMGKMGLEPTHLSQPGSQRRKKASLTRFLVSLEAVKSLRTARNPNRRSGAEKEQGNETTRLLCRSAVVSIHSFARCATSLAGIHSTRFRPTRVKLFRYDLCCYSQA